MRWILSFVLVSCFALPSLAAEPSFEELELSGGQKLRYALVIPDDFDPSRTYPALLALPPGQEDERMVRFGLQLYWGSPAAERGWIVVSPAAPGPTFFTEGGEKHVRTLLTKMKERYSIEGDRFYLAGVSVGGIRAFQIGDAFPDLFHALLTLPGYPHGDALDGLNKLVSKPVRLFVGGDDTEWVEKMRSATKQLEELGGDVELTIFPGQGHTPKDLNNGRFMEELERVRTSLNRK